MPPPAPLPSDPPAGARTPVGDGEAAQRTFAVTSVAWAPSCGRSYHLVATGARDGKVRIWRVKPPTPHEDLEDETEAVDGAGAWTASIVGDFDDHK